MLKQREQRQLRTLWRDTGTLRFFRHWPDLAATDAGRTAIRHARAELRWTRRELGETRASLRPVRRLASASVGGIAHLAGWLCIHNGAYPGAPHEGYSRYGTYTGPLQMTRPWAGYDLDWGAMSFTAVYAIAEKVAAAHGFSYSWMAGQWPQTYPPCAGRF
jgi:hypothetical protein